MFQDYYYAFMHKTQLGVKNTNETRNYRFVTNFENSDKYIYEKALAVTNEDMFIKNEAFFGIDHTHELPNHSALWVNTNISNLSKFWKVFDAIRDYNR